jgi:peptidoglycan/xylan/chitin deacetylase (PgdA/CDA1 family)
MKIIISHDVDHITVWEHKKDLIIPKFLARNMIELTSGAISGKECYLRFTSIFKNKWHNIEELIDFDGKESIPSTFFIAVDNALGLHYSLKDANFWIKKISQKNFNVGLHGIAFDNFKDIKNEYNIFKKILKLDDFGIRMHYLRNNYNTLRYLNDTGYIFDSTLYKFQNPFKVGNLWEFPLHIMDGYLFNKNSRWQNQTLEQVKDETKRKIDEAHKKDIKYFTILFHDRYFNISFKNWKDWYIWVIGYLKNNGLEFANYKEAIRELVKESGSFI